MMSELKQTRALYKVQIWKDKGYGAMYTGKDILVPIDQDTNLLRLSLTVWTIVADDAALVQLLEGRIKQPSVLLGYKFKKNMVDKALGPYTTRVLSLEIHKLQNLCVILSCDLKKEFQ